MLNIKLPKGKVSVACERAGARWSHMHEAALMAYKADVETWRKTSTGLPPEWGADGSIYGRKALRLLNTADACTFSTGDVYVSTELWDEIKGFYDG